MEGHFKLIYRILILGGIKMASDSKHAQYIRKNYVRFSLDLKPEILAEFKEKCKNSNTTPTTEIKKFISEYCKNN